MAYTRQYTEDVGWQNTPSVATPINATNLNKMDDAIGNIDAAVYSEFIEAERIATASNVGRVKPDNTTISVDGNGVISVVDGLPEIPLSIAHGGTGNSAGYIRTGNAAGVAGNKATIEGHYNAGVGAYCHVEGSYNDASASANNSHVGGTHNSSQYENQTVIGTYNANSSDDLFEIGNGVSGNRSNAFAVKTNGDASVGRNMTVAGDLTVLGDIIGGTDDIYVKSTNSSGTVSALNIGSFTPVNESILIIHVLNNVATSETTWIVQMGMVSYGILKQDGSYYTDNLTAGQYLMLITDTSHSRFILLSSGSGADVPIATTSVAGKVKPDGSSIIIDVDGTITALGGGDVPIATTQVAGKVKPDGTTITVDSNGVITATGGGMPSDPLTIAHGGTGNTVGYIRTGLASGVTAGTQSTSEGNDTEASGDCSHAEGDTCVASGYASHAEGLSTAASGDYSHAEGCLISTESAITGREITEASGEGAHAEGIYSLASGRGSHAEGKDTTASGDYSHAEGQISTASGGNSHAEGYMTTASGLQAHAEGARNTASGAQSHAGGRYNTAGYDQQTVVGRFNDNKNDTLFEVGNGTATDARSNALEVKSNGNIIAGGTITDGNGNSIPTIATTSVAGKVKPDGTSITVDQDGTIHGADTVPIATTSVAGKVKPDGTTITITQDGTISAVGGGGDEGEMYTGTLLAASWSNKSQTVSVSGLKSSDIGAVGVLNTATAAQYNAAKAAVIKPTTVSNGTITFTCDNVPSVDIPFGILVTGTSPDACIPDGGTTGQALVKHSNTDLDVEWANMPDTSKFYASDDTAFTAIADGDYVPVYDTSASAKKKSLWSNIKSVLKTYFDGLYQPKLEYSTSEQEIGTWINGDKVYQKTLSVTIPTTNTDGTGVLAYTSIGASVKKVISISGIFETSAGNALLIEHTMTPVSSTTIKQTLVGAVLNSSTSTDKNKIFIQNSTKAFNGCSGYVTIQYTKA